jgi:Tol biopolymer transport system component
MSLYRAPVKGGGPNLVHTFRTDRPKLNAPAKKAYDDAPLLTEDARFVLIREHNADEKNLHVRLAKLDGTPAAQIEYPRNQNVDWATGEFTGASVDWNPRAGVEIIQASTGRDFQYLDTLAAAGMPAWFRDGKKVALMLFPTDSPASLMTMNRDGSAQRRYVLSTPPASPWAPLGISPDSRHAAYIGGVTPLTSSRTVEIVDLSTGQNRRVLTSGPRLVDLQWRSDSRALIYTTTDLNPSGFSVYEVSIDGKTRLIKSLPRSAYPGNSAFIYEPRGAQTATDMIVQMNAGANATLVPLDGSPSTTVIDGASMGENALSPDRRFLAIRKSGPANRRRLTVVSMSDLSERTVDLTFDPGPGVAWGAAGEKVFLVGTDKEGGPQQLYEVPLSGGPAKRLGDVESSMRLDAMSSPDGEHVAVRFGLQGTMTMFMMNLQLSGGR